MQKTPFSAAASVQSMPEVEAVQPNTTTHSLCSGPWEQLLSIIGDAAMLHLLLHTTLFQALPNGCFLQLTGPPVSKVASRAHMQVEGSMQGHMPACGGLVPQSVMWRSKGPRMGDASLCDRQWLPDKGRRAAGMRSVSLHALPGDRSLTQHGQACTGAWQCRRAGRACAAWGHGRLVSSLHITPLQRLTCNVP